MTPSITRLKLCTMTHWNGRVYQLAARCAIDKGDLYRYMGGTTAMPMHHRAILAHVLGVEPEQLDGWFDGSDLWELIQSA